MALNKCKREKDNCFVYQEKKEKERLEKVKQKEEEKKLREKEQE